jgi:predicted RNase H-like HicB family nuclease
MRYAIVIHKDPGSSYGVTVPGLPGCFSAGDTLDEVFDNVREAITGHVETLLMDGQPVPEEAPLEEYQASGDYADGIWGLVDVDLSKLSESVLGKAVRVNVTFPQRVLVAVDEAAARARESRSGFLARAALEHMAK